MPNLDYAPLDEALALIANYGPELDNGNFNHAPMVCEALCALGRPEAVMPWLGRYEARMMPRPRSSNNSKPRKPNNSRRPIRMA